MSAIEILSIIDENKGNFSDGDYLKLANLCMKVHNTSDNQMSSEDIEQYVAERTFDMENHFRNIRSIENEYSEMLQIQNKVILKDLRKSQEELLRLYGCKLNEPIEHKEVSDELKKKTKKIEIYHCKCGSKVQKVGKAIHFKSKKHKKYLSRK